MTGDCEGTIIGVWAEVILKKPYEITEGNATKSGFFSGIYILPIKRSTRGTSYFISVRDEALVDELQKMDELYNGKTVKLRIMFSKFGQQIKLELVGFDK